MNISLYTFNSSFPLFYQGMKKFLTIITNACKTGLTPLKIALSITIGLSIALYPVLGGISSLFMIAAAFLFRLNFPIMFLLNYLAWPLQIALIIPHIRIGEWIFPGHMMHMSFEQIKNIFLSANITEMFSQISWFVLYASTGWLVTTLFITSIGTLILLPVLQHFFRKKEITQYL